MSDRLSSTNVGRKSGGTRLPSPAAGAYFPVFVNVGDQTTLTRTDTYNLDSLFPAGMKFRVLGLAVLNAAISAGTVTAQLGTAADPDAIVTAVSGATGVAAYSPCDGADAYDIDGAGNGDYLFNPADGTTPLDELRLTITSTGLTCVGLQVMILVCPLYHPDLIVERTQPTILS